MKSLQASAVGKTAVALLLLFSSFVGVLFGIQVLAALPLSTAGSWQETAPFYTLLQNRESELAAYYAYQLAIETDQALTYMERQQIQDSIQTLESKLAPEATWFRYQIRSADGQTVLHTNLAEDESLTRVVASVRYATFLPGERAVTENPVWYQDSLSAADSFSPTSNQPETVSSPLVIECGVPLDVENGSIQDEFSMLSFDHQNSQANFLPRLTGCLLLSALACACLLYLLWTAGHQTGTQGIVLTWQEHISFDLYLAFMCGASIITVACMAYLCDQFHWYSYTQFGNSADFFSLLLLSAAALATLALLILTLSLRTFVVRLKAHALVRTTLTLRLLNWCWQTTRNFVRNLPLTWRLVVGFLVYLLLQLFVLALQNGFGLLLLILLNIGVLLLICWWTSCFHHLRVGSQAIAAGNLNHQIDTTRLPHDLRLYAEDLNNISAGLSSAVDEKMKSERFKAELITNVSHDLKTPLTSIINYVTLLKSTQQSDQKAAEYIDVLDRKSQRLKKLTEDLVEASKASTGVLSVNREKIGVAQLIDQALGEWAEKLQAQNLTVITSLPEGETWVYADGRHLWRVIDNLLSNCAKYAMENTRVYLDLTRSKGQVVLSVKNISQESLNVPPERLMERFVRGEESRTTEGSGLGLSIARSLTELQGGTFEVTVDGDLFKSTVTLPQAN